MKKAERLASYKQQYRELARSLSQIGFIWRGNVQRRMLPCKQQHCLCNTKGIPQHGPYPYWTTKVNQKTVTKLLTAEEADLYEQWIHNRRLLEQTLKRMNNLSKKAAKLLITDRKNTF